FKFRRRRFQLFTSGARNDLPCVNMPALKWAVHGPMDSLQLRTGGDFLVVGGRVTDYYLITDCSDERAPPESRTLARDHVCDGRAQMRGNSALTADNRGGRITELLDSLRDLLFPRRQCRFDALSIGSRERVQASDVPLRVECDRLAAVAERKQD